MSAPTLVASDVSHAYSGVEVLSNVSLSVAERRTLAVVGESGAGKSTLARILAGLERPRHGQVEVDGRPLRLRPGVVAPVQMVFQHPADALNQYISVGASVTEPLRRCGRREKRARARELLELVGLDPERADQKPRDFSGGQLQRLVTARALAAEPKVLLCDEPTSALDVSVQAEIINLLLRLQHEKQFACVLVTHDLGVARVLADEVLVLESGRVVECTRNDAFFDSPSEEYSRRLLASTREQMLTSVEQDWLQRTAGQLRGSEEAAAAGQ